MGSQEAPGTTATTDRLCLQLFSQPEHPLKWSEKGQTSSLIHSGPQVKQQKCLTSLPTFSLDLALCFAAGLTRQGGFTS